MAGELARLVVPPVSLQPGGAERSLQFPESVLVEARSEESVQQQQLAVQPVPRQCAIPFPGWRSAAVPKSLALDAARVPALRGQVR